jgi:DNA polymerase-3 subunit gamma/tau
MLSKSAFNALLKTLEEPPKNTIFLLATTEINKIPDTILSRTIVLNLQLVTTELIKEQLIKILEKENSSYDHEALEYIAKLANGSVRDAISFLETSMLYSNDLNKENVIKVLGVLDIKTIRKLITCPTFDLINSIDETVNGFRLSLLFMDELIDFIAEGMYEYKIILGKISEGLLSIKDPLILNKYIKSILISNLEENVSRETIVNENEENVSRETIQDKKDEVKIEDEKEEIIIEDENEELVIGEKEDDKTIHEESEDDSKKEEIIVEEEKTIFDHVTTRDIIIEMTKNKELELNMLRNK